ncbi:Ubiquitin-related modifier 1 [Lecanora helva]
MDIESKDERMLPVVVDGGLELLFSNQRKHHLCLPSSDVEGRPANLAHLIKYLCDELMKDPRKDMFIVNETVRPGVLVLVNDADWELEGQYQYELKKDDNILFVSTLHGG